MDKKRRSRADHPWVEDPPVIERAKISLAVSLSHRNKDELIRMLMQWLGENDIEAFCRTFLSTEEIGRIESAASVQKI